MWKRLVAITLGLLLVGACGISRGEAEKKKTQSRLDEMATKLGLDDKQKDEVGKIFKEYQEKISHLEKERHEAISKVLTPEQQTKLQEMLKARAPMNKGAKEPGKENNSNNNNNNNEKKNENK